MGILSDIIHTIEGTSSRWYGHVPRLPDQPWSKKSFQWQPIQYRKRGRSRRSWKESLNDVVTKRNLSINDSQNRKVFK